jgi:hypothetical protein
MRGQIALRVILGKQALRTETSWNWLKVMFYGVRGVEP